MRNDNNNNPESDPDLEELKKAWEDLQTSLKSKKDINISEVDELNKALVALHEDQKRNTPVVKKPVVQKPKASYQPPNPIPKLPNPKRGFLGRILRKAYKNYMYSTGSGTFDYDYHSMWMNGDLEFEDMIEVEARNAIINSPQYQNQLLADQIAANQEELQRRTISQAMTWLVPRFEDKLDEISQKIKKDW